MKLLESCRRITKRSKSNFYYSFLFLPRSQREAIYAVYAFCRCIDDVVDHSPSAVQAAEDLKQWRDLVRKCRDAPLDHPVLTPLGNAIREFNIPIGYFEELINGVEMDLYKPRYETFETLRPYCYRVASIVGLICIEIFGHREPATREHAVHQGIAFQLTNIIRDVKTDAQRDRIYIPLEDLNRFGYSEHDLLSRVYNPAFVELMRFQCERAKAYYRAARSFLTPRDRPNLVASEIMGRIYFRILEEIERSNYNVFNGKISLSSGSKLALALRGWLANRFNLQGTEAPPLPK